MRATRSTALVLALAATAGGCGLGGGGDDRAQATADVPAARTVPTTGAAEPEASGPVRPAPPDAAIVRAWSAALNANDNAAAARLFAPGALVYGDEPQPLPDVAVATAWNASFPCGGELVDLRVVEGAVVATFRLTERPAHVCDAPGELAAAAFVVSGERIVGFARVAPYGATAPPDDGQAI